MDRLIDMYLFKWCLFVSLTCFTLHLLDTCFEAGDIRPVSNKPYIRGQYMDIAYVYSYIRKVYIYTF